MGATNWNWNGMTYHGAFSVEVNDTSPVVTETLHGEQLNIYNFNITGGNVSISIGCKSNSTIETYYSLTGDCTVQFKYPTATPSRNYAQDFYVTVNLLDSNATVDCVYYFRTAMHSDESVTYFLPGYEESHALGEILFLDGLIVAGIFMTVGVIVFLMSKKQ